MLELHTLPSGHHRSASCVTMSSLGMDLNVSLKGYADVVCRRTGTSLIAGSVDWQEVSIAQGGPLVFFWFCSWCFTPHRAGDSLLHLFLHPGQANTGGGAWYQVFRNPLRGKQINGTESIRVERFHMGALGSASFLCACKYSPQAGIT